MDLEELGDHEYSKRLNVTILRWQVYGTTGLPPVGAVSALAAGEAELRELAAERAALQVLEKPAGVEMRGEDTTGLAVVVRLRMAQVPTSIYHLFDPAERPLVSCEIRNYRREMARLRVMARIAGYSTRAVDTIEVEADTEPVTIGLLPTLLPGRLRQVIELTGAVVEVLVEDLDGAVELHRTVPVQLLARTTVPLSVRDPTTELLTDLSRYLGAFVTPNAPEVMAFLRTVADTHTLQSLPGYQGSPEVVTAQVKAVFDALAEAGVVYVNSVLANNPEEGTATQRVRLPRESLAHRQANCVDGTVLVASILEAMSLNPAIVMTPGHALIGWETWRATGDWRYLETTMIGTDSFDAACTAGEQLVAAFPGVVEDGDDPYACRRWPLRVLRIRDRVLPME